MSFLSKVKNLFLSKQPQQPQANAFKSSSNYRDKALLNWFAQIYTGKSQITSCDEQTLLARLYDAFRNQMMARAYPTNVTLGSINTGLSLNPSINNKVLGHSEKEEREIEEDIRTEFAIWSKNCDLERNLTFEQMQFLVALTARISGNAFINSTSKLRFGERYETKLQAVDSQRVCSPNLLDTDRIIGGIELNKNGVAVKIHVLKVHPSELNRGEGFKGLNQWEALPVYGSKTGVRRVFHVYTPFLPNQAKGVSSMTSMLPTLKDADRYFQAELDANVFNSSLVAFLKDTNTATITAQDTGMLGGIPNDPRTEDEKGNTFDSWEFDKGMLLRLPKGKDIEFFNPDRANTSFDPYVMSLFKQVAAAGNIPLQDLILSFDKSYSAARAAGTKTRLLYNFDINEIKLRFCSHAYLLFMMEAIAKGRIRHIKNFGDPVRREAYLKAEWLPVGQEAIDETKSVKASREKVKAGLSSTPREAAKFSGCSYETLLEEEVKYAKARERAGLPDHFELLDSIDKGGKKEESTKEEND